MSFVTFISAPKPFLDPQIAIIQNNALFSWAQLDSIDICLVGDEEGIADAAARVAARYIPNVTKNEKGTPLISSMIELARGVTNSGLLCIINSDIIVMSDFMKTGRRIEGLYERFVLIGRRWDIDIASPLDFSNGWEGKLRTSVRDRGVLHKPAGSDFFLFPRECYVEVPDFAVGRSGWDNWMIYKARKEKWPVVDGTSSFIIVHQNHDYSHLPHGEPHYSAPETNENIRLAGGEARIRYTVLDATHCLENGHLKRPRITYLRIMRRVELVLRALFFFLPQSWIEEVARPKRWKKRAMRILGKLE